MAIEKLPPAHTDVMTRLSSPHTRRGTCVSEHNNYTGHTHIHCDGVRVNEPQLSDRKGGPHQIFKNSSAWLSYLINPVSQADAMNF